MLDIEGVVLHKILLTGDLDNFSKLRLNFFSNLYRPLFMELYKFYLKQGEVPTFDTLLVSSIKNPRVLESISSLRLLVIPDVPTELAVSSLIDKYVQDEALNSISNMLDGISCMDSTEIKQTIGNILLELDSKLNTDENVIYANQLNIFEEPLTADAKKVPTGISNWMDANIGGFFEEDYVLIGGYRGTGKSIVCANIVANQYLQGNVGVYFTIEMTGQETFNRIMSILAQVPQNHIKLNKLSDIDNMSLVRTRAAMFENADDLVQEYYLHKDKFKFERELIGTKHLKRNNQIIIVDDRSLTVPTIDFTIQKLKAVHGDALKVVVIDYVNQVSLGGQGSDSQYKWEDQMNVSKQLKNIARKYKVAMVSPYQIDKDGVARLSKGILDAPDLAFILQREEGHMVFKGEKGRATDPNFTVKMKYHEETLTIDPAEVPIEKEEPKKKSKLSKAKNAEDDV